MHQTLRALLTGATLLTLAAAPAAAQTHGPGPGDHLIPAPAGPEVRRLPMAPDDPIAQYLPDPGMIVRHQRELGLTESQRAGLKEASLNAQTQHAALQWELQELFQGMTDLLAQANPAEAAVLAQLDQVLATEAKIKRLHLTTALRIRALLTPAQRTQLEQLRGQTPHPPAHR